MMSPRFNLPQAVWFCVTGGKGRWEENLDPRPLFRNGFPMFFQEKENWTVV
jgi:hypothetical protein